MPIMPSIILSFLLMCLTALCGRGLSVSSPSTSQTPTDFQNTIRLAFAKANQIMAHKTADRKHHRRIVATGSSTLAHEMQQAPNERSRKLHATQERFEEAAKIMMNEFSMILEQVFSTKDLRSMLPSDEMEQCQSHFTYNCDPNDKYRTIDGSCNNLVSPSWGTASSCFLRLTKAYYGDGLSSKRKAVSGEDLPNPRQISLEIHSNLDMPSYQQTHMFMAFGQLLDHDISNTPFSVQPYTIECCPPRDDNPPECQQIIISKDDPYYAKFGITCMKITRSASCPTCSLGPRQQTNQMTAYIDASHVYDVDVDSSYKLRNFDGTGTLRFQTSAVAGELPPPSEGSDKDFCVLRNMKNYPNKCFQTGDVRGNQHPALTSLQTMQLREHNRIARALGSMTTNWSAEKIYQETRRILGAEMQMITYNEFLPHVLGPERMRRHDLEVGSDGYTTYDPAVQSSLVTEFSSASYRFGHTLVNRFAEVGRGSHSTFQLKDWFFYTDGFFHGQMDRVLKGLAVYPRQEADRFFIPDLTNHLFQIRGNDSTGLDLASINIQRGRDHGIPPYIDMVEFCGGPPITSFNQLDQLFQEGYSVHFQNVYESVADIDLYSGGLAEKPVQGGVVGPTFACVIGPQFGRLKFGDRFYFEHGGQAGSFTPDQLRELRKVTLSKLMCDNTEIEQMQPKAMLFPSRNNPVLNCKDLPGIDLTVWMK